MVKTYKTEHHKVQRYISFQFIHVKDCCFLPINHILCKAAISLETELKFTTFSQVVCVSIPIKMPIFHNAAD